MKPEIHAWQIELDGPVTDYTESIFTIGNGYLGMRGYDLQTPKTRKDQHALFRAGFFEPVKPGITDMVQLPDVLGMTVEGYTPANYHQALDMRKGIFTQTWQERGLTVSMLRIASMADPQLLCVRMALTSEWDQTVTVQARMDDRVANLPVHDDQMVEETDGFIFDIPLRAGKTTVIEKRVRVLLDRETPNIESSDPWQAHTDAWTALWRDCDIEMDTDEEIQGAMRWNIFQLWSIRSNRINKD